ncbi:hypothetical protein ACLSZ5_01350 [Avibacterium avium]
MEIKFLEKSRLNAAQRVWAYFSLRKFVKNEDQQFNRGAFSLPTFF